MNSLKKYPGVEFIDPNNNKIRCGNIEAISVCNPSPRDLKAALKLTYKVYVEERKYFDENELSPDQVREKMLWDKYDYSSQTQHVIATDITTNKVVGRMRLIDGDCPLRGYDEVNDYLADSEVRETSRLVVDPAYRRPDSLVALVGMAVASSREVLEEIKFSSFNSGLSFYEKTGAKVETTFTNNSFTDNKAVLLSLNVRNQNADNNLKKRLQMFA